VLGHRRPIRDGFAGSAVPAGVSAASVSEAGDVSDENSGASLRRLPG
jgi:hypothetical protein